ncbi:39S ribosomal protein L12, mitochondrial [Diprion similis]|uniref:39S ribosomal protein L12, mitochondrial n=1 Tax=Diprion similis TaxID=362088 RepID=UPI001EF948F9|nr:39S ribosomal protein L12, mitochondrial [Diprion similis]
MNSLRLVFRQNLRQLRQFHKCATTQQTATSAQPVEPLTIPVPEGVDKPVSDKIDKIAKDITALNLIEVAELSDVLKKRLNLPDAPIMPIGGFAVGPAAGAEDAEEGLAKKKVQTEFTVKLMKFDEKQKVALIKECKNLLEGMNLVQAKKFVESAPTVVKSDIPKDEAEKIKEALAKVGAVIEIE